MTLIASSAGAFAQLLTLVIVFAIVMALAYFVTKWIATYQQGKGTSGNIEVIETYRMSTNRYIAILRLGKERYVACAVSKDHVEFLAELAADELTFHRGSDEGGSGFREVLNLIRKNGEERGKV